MTFLKGRAVKVWNKRCEVWNSARETLVALDDIKRIKACVVYIHNPVIKKNIGSRVSLVVSAVGRVPDSDREVDFYELTDPIEVIASALNRSPDELSSLLLELEVQE